MKRFVPLMAVAAVLLGVEVAVRTVSLSWLRLQAGFGSLFSEAPLPVSTTRFVVGVALIAVGGFTGAAWGWLRRMERRAAVAGGRCPECGGRTERVRRKKIHKLLSTLVGEELVRRRCQECRWSGLSMQV